MILEVALFFLTTTMTPAGTQTLPPQPYAIQRTNASVPSELPHARSRTVPHPTLDPAAAEKLVRVTLVLVLRVLHSQDSAACHLHV